MNISIIILLLLVNCLAHLIQVFQLLKTFDQEITPLLIFGLVHLALAIALFFGLPYAAYVTLVVMLIGGVGGGNQIMRLDSGGCINWLIVILDVTIVLALGWMLFFT